MLALSEAAAAAGPGRNLLDFSLHALSPPPGLPRIEVTIATYLRGNQTTSLFVDAVRRAGVPLEVLRERRRFDLDVLPQLRALLERCRPDILQTHHVKSHFLVRLAGLWRRYPWVAFNHGYTAVDWKDRLYTRLDRWSLPKARRVVVVCKPLARQMESYGVRPGRIFVRHNPARPYSPPPPDAIERTRAEAALPPGAKVVLSIGRLSREKGHADLLDAFSILRQRHPGLSVRLLLVGDGRERAALERQSERLRLGDLVHFAGYRSDVRPYYSLAHVLALPSHSEGSPNVVLEALCAGVPVVAAAVGGVPEMIRDGATGRLVPTRNPAALAGALAEVLDCPELACRLSAAGREAVARDYPFTAYAQSLACLYRDILSG